jgi:hypothetical protein
MPCRALVLIKITHGLSLIFSDIDSKDILSHCIYPPCWIVRLYAPEELGLSRQIPLGRETHRRVVCQNSTIDSCVDDAENS